MHKLMEIAVSALVIILIAAPVVAGVYVGLSTNKAAHGTAQAAESHGEAHIAPEAGHTEAQGRHAAGDGGSGAPINPEDWPQPHGTAGGVAGGGAPGVAGGHAPEPGATPDNPKEPEFQQGDSMKPKLCGSQELVGQPLKVAEEKLRAAHKIYRKVKPGMPMTMDYSEDRINLDLDDHDVVTRVWCG